MPVSNEYTKHDKKKLIDKINKIHDKQCHKEIKKIIEKNNPKLESTKNSNGVFIYFNDLNKKTYGLIETYLNKYEKIQAKIKESEIIEDNSSNETDSSSEFKEIRKNPIKKLKLTNAEQHILNQVKYKNTISELTEASESDIFIRKRPNKKN